MKAMRCGGSIVALVGLTWTAMLPAQQPPTSTTRIGDKYMNSDEAARKGQQLVEALYSTYKNFDKNSSLDRQQDVTKIALEYIREGDSLADVRSVLLAAGCTENIAHNGQLLFIGSLDAKFPLAIKFSIYVTAQKSGEGQVVSEVRGGSAFWDSEISGILAGRSDRRRVFHETTAT